MTSESGIPNAAPAAESKTPAGEAPQAATEAVEALQDRLLRALADAENARRQAERARSEGRRAGVADLIARLAQRARRGQAGNTSADHGEMSGWAAAGGAHAAYSTRWPCCSNSARRVFGLCSCSSHHSSALPGLPSARQA